MLRTTVQLGTRAIEVEAPTIQELLGEVQYIQELDAAREGVQAEPFFRDWKGMEFIGFRRKDGAEVYWGQHIQAPHPTRRLFTYAPTSHGYVGWTMYDRERGERVRVADSEADPSAYARAVPANPPRPQEEPPSAASLQEARLQYIRAAFSHIPAMAHGQIRDGGRRTRILDLKSYIRSHSDQIQTNESLAGEIVSAVSKATGLPFEAAIRREETPTE